MRTHFAGNRMAFALGATLKLLLSAVRGHKGMSGKRGPFIKLELPSYARPTYEPRYICTRSIMPFTPLRAMLVLSASFPPRLPLWEYQLQASKQVLDLYSLYSFAVQYCPPVHYRSQLQKICRGHRKSQEYSSIQGTNLSQDSVPHSPCCVVSS